MILTRTIKAFPLFALLALGACGKVAAPPGTPAEAAPRVLSNEEWLRLAQVQPAINSMFGALSAAEALSHSRSIERSTADGKAAELDCESHLLALTGARKRGYAGMVRVEAAGRTKNQVWTISDTRAQTEAEIEKALAEHCKA